MRIKVIMIYHFISIKLAKFKKNYYCQNAEERVLLYIVAGDVNSYSFLGKQSDSPHSN